MGKSTRPHKRHLQITSKPPMKASFLATKKFDMTAIKQALDDMRRSCGGGDVPAKLVSSTARLLKLTPVEFAEAAAMINRPFATSHVR